MSPSCVAHSPPPTCTSVLTRTGTGAARAAMCGAVPLSLLVQPGLLLHACHPAQYTQHTATTTATAPLRVTHLGHHPVQCLKHHLLHRVTDDGAIVEQQEGAAVRHDTISHLVPFTSMRRSGSLGC